MKTLSYKVDKNSPIPIYHQISVSLRRRILAREWAIGEKISGEFDLAEEYQVSRVTLRQALRELESDGLIRKVQGVGIFVEEIPQMITHDFSLPSTLCAKLGQQGISLDARLIVLEQIRGTPDILEHLCIDETQPVIHIYRTFEYENRPIALNSSWIASTFLPEILEQGLIESHLSLTLSNRYHLTPVRIKNSIQAERATASDISLLHVRYDTPMIVVSSVSYLEQNVPLEYSRTVWLGDQVKFHFDLD